MYVSFDQLQLIRQQHPQARIVLAGGVFDLLHVAHVDYLQIRFQLPASSMRYVRKAILKRRKYLLFLYFVV